MSNPFYYSKTKHKRTITPPVFGGYRQYKPYLQQEFAAQCVYCRAVDRIKGYDNFGVDYYRPQKKFPFLINDYLNLYYACNRCNRLKRNWWPTAQQAKNGQYIPNPCDNVMFDHLRYQGGKVFGHSKVGYWTIDKLDLNDPSAVLFRGSLIKIVDSLVSQIHIEQANVADAKNAVLSATSSQKKAAAESILKLAEANLTDVQSTLTDFLG